MSEGFELSTFHVPQQSRRDKLRETAAVAAAAAASHSGLLPLYDHPALLTSPSSILTCSTPDTAPHLVKEEGLNFMGFAAAASSSSHMFLDPCAQEDIPSPFFYPPQHAPHAHPIRDFCYPGPAPHAALSYVPPAQGLSLSLSSSSEYPNRSTVANQPTAGIFDQKGGGGGGCGAARGFSIVGGGMSRSSVPLGPFTGYSAVLKGSRFLEPARELLEEFCDVGRGGIAVPRRAGAGAGSSAEDDREMESLSGAVLGDGAAGISEDRRRKTRLVSLLNESSNPLGWMGSKPGMISAGGWLMDGSHFVSVMPNVFVELMVVFEAYCACRDVNEGGLLLLSRSRRRETRASSLLQYYCVSGGLFGSHLYWLENQFSAAVL
ncbi:BEL1-like homeodomain protein [Asimina triloba]